MKIIISPNQLVRQKRILIVFSIFLILISIAMIGQVVFEQRYILLFSIPICIILPFHVYRDMKRIRSISFDDSTVYYQKYGSINTIKVSFENIKSITVGQFNSTYRINLISANEDGPYLYFKHPVFWIPFIHDGKLEQVYELRDKIDAFKINNDEDYTGQTQVLKLTEV